MSWNCWLQLILCLQDSAMELWHSIVLGALNFFSIKENGIPRSDSGWIIRISVWVNILYHTALNCLAWSPDSIMVAT
ncbi:unnamed protein product [Victoria cruziana]